jgi:phosphoserine aminotransferase
MEARINFNAGPAALPPEVLHEASLAVKKYKKTGLSILELPHRSREFRDILEECNAHVTDLCGLGDNYEVLWLQGGGRMQFCMVPMNFLPQNGSAGYIDSGHWAEEALEYAAHYGDVQILASSKASNYNRLPEWPKPVPKQLAYLHVTTNNTICGTQWHHIPKTNVPLIADMSSDIFSSRRDYSGYAMFYAAAQKNLGIAGIALAVVRKDMLERIARPLPAMLSYQQHAKEKSILNTANVYGVYVSLLMLRWIKAKGIAAIEEENRRKAELLYKVLDNSRLFMPHVSEKAHRSLMNVCFTAKTAEAEQRLLTLCEQNRITGVSGHRSVGGFRVSLYNAVALEDVALLAGLIEEMKK